MEHWPKWVYDKLSGQTPAQSQLFKQQRPLMLF